MDKPPRHIKRSQWTAGNEHWNGTLEGKDIGTNVTVLIYTFKKVGEGPKWHVHTYDEIFIVRTGRVMFTVGEEKFEAEAGDILFGPANIPHKYSNLGPGPLETTDIHLNNRFVQTSLEDPELVADG